MFGFVIGTVCLVGLVAMVRGFGHSHRARDCGRRGLGARRVLRRLFSRLETTPSQEKEIVEALGAFKTEARSARSQLDGARGEVASALRQEVFDEVLLGAALTRVDGTVDVLRKAALDAFGRVHGALDDKQRGILADWIERGPRGFHTHPYRL